MAKDYTRESATLPSAEPLSTIRTRATMTKSNLNPESDWTVRIESNILRSVDWYGNQVVLDLSKIIRFYVRTTDQGPFSPDVWYGVVCENGKIEIPQGATGEELILDLTEKLDGFRIEGMFSVENRKFDCWTKT